MQCSAAIDQLPNTSTLKHKQPRASGWLGRLLRRDRSMAIVVAEQQQPAAAAPPPPPSPPADEQVASHQNPPKSQTKSAPIGPIRNRKLRSRAAEGGITLTTWGWGLGCSAISRIGRGVFGNLVGNPDCGDEENRRDETRRDVSFLLLRWEQGKRNAREGRLYRSRAVPSGRPMRGPIDRGRLGTAREHSGAGPPRRGLASTSPPA